MSLGRLLIAMILVLLVIGPRRWIAWGGDVRARIRFLRSAARERRDDAADTHASPQDPPGVSPPVPADVSEDREAPRLRGTGETPEDQAGGHSGTSAAPRD